MSTSTAEPVAIPVHKYPCVQGGQLRLTYLLSAPDVRAYWKDAYQQHVATCNKCRKFYNDCTARAIRAEHPEMGEE